MIKLALAALLIGLVACGGGGNNNVIIPDGDPGPMICNPRAQTGCEPGQKCANRLLQTTPSVISEIACVPDGSVDIGGACMSGPAGAMGYSNCKAGGECINNVCKQICDHQGGDPKCDTNHACSRYSDVFESNNMAVAGVCDAKCDPLTQELAIGVDKAACGSMNPAMADNGCFSFDLIDFTCAGIPDEALALTDRMRAFGPPGGVYVNGCAAGYLPLLIEETGSMTGICVGICAPAKSDNSSPERQSAALGDITKPVKLHNKAMAEAGDGVCQVGAKGSEDQQNCHFLWWYNIENNMILQSQHNDTAGICFGYSHYKVNHDNNPNTPTIGFPNCADLPPAGGTANPEYGFANEWPCVPTAEIAQVAPGKAKLNPVAKDFRLGARPGPGVRHTLRQE